MFRQASTVVLLHHVRRARHGCAPSRNRLENYHCRWEANFHFHSFLINILWLAPSGKLSWRCHNYRERGSELRGECALAPRRRRSPTVRRSASLAFSMPLGLTFALMFRPSRATLQPYGSRREALQPFAETPPALPIASAPTFEFGERKPSMSGGGGISRSSQKTLIRESLNANRVNSPHQS